MFRVSFKGFDNLEKEARAKINQAITDPRFLQPVGDQTLKNIKQSLLQGKDPSTRETHKNKLSPATTTRKKELAKYNTTIVKNTQNKALVFTGQLIESLTYKIKSGKPFIDFFAKGTHSPYRGANGRTVGKAISNQKLLEIHHRGQGQKVRKMIGISDQGKKSILSVARKALIRLLK